MARQRPLGYHGRMDSPQDAGWIAGWNHSFAHEWEGRQGREQTRFFALVTLYGLPEPFKRQIEARAPEILDWGCALGDALAVFQTAFPRSPLTGLDISSVAIAKAAERYPFARFTTTPLRELGRKPPLVYTSNCLEHFADPLALLQTDILPGVGDYLVILVPYLEIERCAGHLVTFSQTSFPPVLGDFGLLFWRVLPTGNLPGSLWSGRQLLLIYARKTAFGMQEMLPELMQWAREHQESERESYG